jgi:hypothetical protein
MAEAKDKTPYKDEKPTGAKARANEDEGNSHVSRDVFTEPALAFLANAQTAVDAQGIERITSPSYGDFVPAPMEASDEEKAHAEKVAKVVKEARERRLGQLQGEIKDEDRAKNNPGEGGSVTSPSS